jgi:hypothetical protein
MEQRRMHSSPIAPASPLRMGRNSIAMLTPCSFKPPVSLTAIGLMRILPHLLAKTYGSPFLPHGPFRDLLARPCGKYDGVEETR